MYARSNIIIQLHLERLIAKNAGKTVNCSTNDKACIECSSEYYESVEGKCEEKKFFCDFEKISNS